MWITRQKTTLNEQIERYLSVKASLAVGTSENYWYYFKKDIKQDIGVRKLTELKKSDILEYYKGKSLNDDYSNGTIHILHKIIHPALQLAVDDDLIMKNPADGCMKEYPEDAQEKYALSFQEENEFLERLAQRARIKRYYPMIAIMLCSGLRISETLGLTWDDIDMDKKSISVNHQLQYRKVNGKMKRYVIGYNKSQNAARTKTKSGTREIPMNDKLYNLFILQRKEWFKMEKDTEFCVDGYRDFVFLSHVTGHPLYHSNIRRMINKIVDMNASRDVQLPPITPHILRHTACTRFLESGMDVKTVQYLMGHTDIRTTMEVYNHINMDRVKRELEKLSVLQNSYTNFYTKMV